MIGEDFDRPSPTLMRSRLRDVLERGQVVDFYRYSDARLYIGEVSVRRSGSLDIAATAEKLGILIEYDPKMISGGHYLPTSAWTNEYGVPVVTLNTGKESAELQQIFGHEVGHHFLEEVLGMNFTASEHNDISEVFCEVFGTEMATPGEHPLADTEARAKKDYRIPADYMEHIINLQMGYY